MKTTRIQASPCPYCGRILTNATSPAGYEPAYGDVTICVECAGVCRFGLGLILEAVPEPELSEVLQHPKVIKASTFVQARKDVR